MFSRRETRVLRFDTDSDGVTSRVIVLPARFLTNTCIFSWVASSKGLDGLILADLPWEDAYEYVDVSCREGSRNWKVAEVITRKSDDE